MRSFQLRFALVLSLPFAALAATTMPPPANVKVDFNKDIQPILEAKCYSCHGSKVQQSGLRLDKRQNALRGGDYGIVIDAGHSAESKLIKKLVNGDGGLQMPPSGPLAADEISLLRAWIDQGADFGTVEVKEEPVLPVDPKLKEIVSAVHAQNQRAVQKLVKANPAMVKAGDGGGSTLLHHAAGFGTIAIMKLLLDNGADVNAKNRLGATPLHWAFTDVEKTRLLIEKGANVNAKIYDGRSALYMAASQHDSDAVLKLLLEKGADPNLPTLTGRTPLMSAAGAGEVKLVKALLDKGANVNLKSSAGSTAILDAAAGRNVEVVRLLIEKGSDVNARSKRMNSALSAAAMHGSEDIAKLLIEKGADVNIADDRGYTPLMYAAYSDRIPASTVRLLLAKGANPNATGEGETPRSLAAKHGDNEVARILGVPEREFKNGAVPVGEPGSPENRPIPQAVQKALAQLEKQSVVFVKKAGCNSCHNQSLPNAAAALARDRGIRAPEMIMELPLAMVEKSPERTMTIPAVNINSFGYEAFALTSAHRPADDYTEAAIRYLKMMQMPEGYWQTVGVRPPLTSDDFITTAMTINTLRTYSPAVEKADSDKRIARAAAWLEAAHPTTTQERAFQLLGLAWAKANPAAIERSAHALAQTQRADGGWSQLPGMGSDAYATGEALYALNIAGNMKTDAPVYQNGAKYLLRTQSPEGVWHVKTRSLWTQPYFDSGFPFSHDQWISSAGTSWAVMALSLTVEPVHTTRAKR